MKGAARKTSTARVRKHRALAKAGKIRVVLWLDEEALKARRVVEDWNSPKQNREAAAAFARLHLSGLLKL